MSRSAVPARGDAPVVLGIETSCDETAAAVVDASGRVLSNVVASQPELHEKYGGVVPEIASRRHLEAVIPVLAESLERAGLSGRDLDAIAVTTGPGLVGALLVGISAAKALGIAWGKPVLGINHLVGHVYANFLEGREDLWEGDCHRSTGAANHSASADGEVRFPAVCLVASGGHTDVVLLRAHGCFEVLGRTRDDAAGEVLDKIARAAGLGYPGGPQVERAAAGGDPGSVSFPRAFLEPGSLDFSFSGLKTAVLIQLKSRKTNTAADLSNLMASFQEAVMDVLAQKTVAAVDATRARSALLAGGVAANKRLRTLLGSISAVPVFAPPLEFCTDNAAMIARAGAERLRLVGHDPNWPYLDGAPDLAIRSWLQPGTCTCRG